MIISESLSAESTCKNAIDLSFWTSTSHMERFLCAFKLDASVWVVGALIQWFRNRMPNSMEITFDIYWELVAT